jgi:adenosylcobinamide kinase/adenosylcobinamide-phosphate guanylyltransferase
MTAAPKTGATKTLLVLGGARSGKSSYAQKLAEESGLKPLLIATAIGFDREMRVRIENHKAQRNENWDLIEEPTDLKKALVSSAKPGRLILVDCATLWLNNLMMEEKDAGAAIAELADTIRKLSCPVIFVSNEVGQGIVPDNPLAREFCDNLGKLNQKLASVCDVVVQMSAGLPIQLKPHKGPDLRF